MSFAAKYHSIIADVLHTGVAERNARTGRGVVVLPAGASFALDLRDGLLPTVGRRLTRPTIAAAELAWCLLGHNHCDWLRKHTKVWDQFCDIRDCVECDGTGRFSPTPRDADGWNCTICNGTGKTHWLNEAYGFRWSAAFGVDQLDTAMSRLIIDPSDRRCWISSWDPRVDIQPVNQKTVPCPVGFTLQIVDGRLCSTLMIRSSDLFMGLPYDVMRHTLLMAAVAAELRVQLGHARFTLANPHIYGHQLLLAAEMLEKPVIEPQIALPNWPASRVKQDADYYVESFSRYCASFEWPMWNPKSEVAV